MEFKTVLFDFDGTVANTLPLCIHGFKSVFKKYDHRSIDTEGIISMFGPTDDAMIRKNLRDQDAVPEAIEFYYQIYTNEHKKYVGDHPAILRLLKALKRRQIQVGLITGKSRRAYTISEKLLGFEGFFQSVITGDDVTVPKPDPQGILKMLDHFHANKETAIYIGDSNNDILAGKAAGIHTAAVQWFPMSQSGSYPAGPDYYWTDVNDFIDLLQRSNPV
ncbi:HAD family hydrolase [Sporolactobacillus vineae]|uniref:HAD family hydrolase n=1 Tax=Sporolactobacillus vineae TaxID=444463 RepID=UPI00028A360C|nr:HAD family hydrolase [Sporolactobacillus vineae]